MNKWKMIISLSILMCFFACSPYSSRGSYRGYRSEVDRSRTCGYLPEIECRVPDAYSSSLEVRVKKRTAYPLLKVNLYERIITETKSGQYMAIGMIAGALLGAVATNSKGDGDTLKNVFMYGTIGGLGGYLVGSLFRVKRYSSSKDDEERTTEVIGKEPGDVAGMYPGIKVKIRSPQWALVDSQITNNEGKANFKLDKIFTLNEWEKDRHDFEIIISTDEAEKTTNVDPNYWLKPYFKITKARDRIRLQPHMQGMALADCFQNEKYFLLSSNGDWNKIDYRGKPGWIQSSSGRLVMGSEFQFDPSKPPQLLARLAFQEPSGNNILDADEEGKIVLTVQNNGKGAAYNIGARLRSITLSPEISLTDNWQLPQLFPGEIKIIEIPVKASYRVTNMKNVINLDFSEQFGYPPDPIQMTFSSREEQKPDLVIERAAIDDDSYGQSYGDDDKQVELGETVEVEVTIANRGVGKAENVQVNVSCSEANLFLGTENQFNLGEIAPRDNKSFRFIFSTNKLFRGPELLPLMVKISEKRDRFSKVPLSLAIPTNRNYAGPNIVVVDGNSLDEGDSESSELDIEDVPQGQTQKRTAMAVIIGNRNYQKPGVPAVDFAARDASLVRQYVSKLFGYRDENILYFEDATKADFEQLFGNITQPHGRLHNLTIPNQSDVFVYYTGHGAPDIASSEAYFVPVDCDPTFVQLTGYSLETFFRNMAELKAKSMTIIIDACFSGYSEAGFLLRNISPIIIQVKYPVIQNPGLVLFTSCRKDQVAHWYPTKHHSLFTYYFLEGIKKMLSEKQPVTASNLNSYISSMVEQMARRLYGREQNPTFIGMDSNLLY